MNAKVRNAIKDVMNADIYTGLDTLRKLERILIDADCDEADMCLPHLESLIILKSDFGMPTGR